jgi:hypothetical protein
MSNINKPSSEMNSQKLFLSNKNDFSWNNLPFYLRDQYNYMLGIVYEKDKAFIDEGTKNDFKFYNPHTCFALNGFSTSKDRTLHSYCDALLTESDLNRSQCFPLFNYNRRTFVADKLNTELSRSGHVNMGAAIWLYYYEKMGIFKILGALLDDYNYKGKYTIKDNESYSVLIEHVSVLYRMGIASNMRDRVCLYEKSMGLTIENNFGMNTTRNEGFMKTFDDILKQALEHYSYRRLDNAIGAGTGAVRSSVATLTTIKDSLENLKNQFQAYYYGRNTLNTLLGIATVYATICLVRLLKSEIGISNQYTRPQDFIPAAYDILVMNKPAMNTDSNRFITYDNCASYGYRLLTDFEFIDSRSFNPTGGVDDPMNLWLNDIEPLVEGYKSALKSIKD